MCAIVRASSALVFIRCLRLQSPHQLFWPNFCCIKRKFLSPRYLLLSHHTLFSFRPFFLFLCSFCAYNCFCQCLYWLCLLLNYCLISVMLQLFVNLKKYALSEKTKLSYSYEIRWPGMEEVQVELFTCFVNTLKHILNGNSRLYKHECLEVLPESSKHFPRVSIFEFSIVPSVMMLK